MNNNFRIDPNDLITTTTSTPPTTNTNTNTNCAAYKDTVEEGGGYPYILFMTDVDGKVDLDQNSIVYFSSIPKTNTFGIFYRISSSGFSYQLYKSPNQTTNIYIRNIDEERISVVKQEPDVEDVVTSYVRDTAYTTYRDFYDAAIAAVPP